MQCILFIIHPSKGPINATMQLAKRFRERGYPAAYLVPPDLKQFIEQQQHTAVTDIFDEYNPDIFVRDVIQKKNIGLVIIDAGQLAAAILLYKVPVGKIMINTSFHSDKEYKIPPFFSPTLPSPSWLSFLRIEWEWLRWFIRKDLLYFRRQLLSRGKDDMYKKRLAEKAGFPLKKFANFRRPWLYGFDNYPEFILFPPELDFPRRTTASEKYYTGPFVFTDRKEDKFDWKKIDPSLPVLYCALGTVASIYFPRYIRLYEILIDIFSQRQDVNLVLAAGGFYDQLKSRNIPMNISIYRTAPQLQVLQRTQVMITHGGGNSIKECIRLGVPMMIYPLVGMTDNNGNAARVVYHKLGKRGNALADSPGKIETDIDSVRQDRLIKANILKMQSVFMRHEEKEHRIVDRMLSYIHRP